MACFWEKLLCHSDHSERRQHSKRKWRFHFGGLGKRSPTDEPGRRQSQGIVDLPASLSRNNTDQASAGATTPAQDEILSTASLPLSETEARFISLSESPGARSDGVAKLVVDLQRRVWHFVQNLDLENNRARSRTRSQIYKPVLDLAQRGTRNSLDHTDVAKQLQQLLPLSPSSRSNSDLVHICQFGVDINEARRRNIGHYDFGELNWERETEGRRTEFPELKKDGCRLLKEVEYQECGDDQVSDTETVQQAA
ncbi:hypothetical protein, variant [Cladophialophora immunda]|uniref:Uncharacterized protein n=1 Tax=Cladophialophora immunda TaxID=569365 RepID=A0A0D2C7P3_9EURO|nr:uncharacterized protein PV07_09573 [Cladophialophora immunda]XP_016246697.1 hypothetical protein, variant [Cladophialophora immunda]KIW26480.1 hypothetical protein PV07_09573 [Cladophialophora immunda]KIW26481.1 hypothetical protein, variant [Cladophialophora immunda]